MTKMQFIPLLLCGSLTTQAWAADDENDIPTVEVIAERISEVSVEEVKSADLAEALTKKVAGISLVRRSGIANDIILRGQKKDNINILVDNSKVYGACPNRMDPPTSHILTNNIEEVEVTEGPYDVENFGTLSGAVKITTRKPQPEFHGDVSINAGSFGYEKFAATLSGGSENTRGLVSFSRETGAQYEDGDGRDFYEQIEADNPGTMANYKPEYRDMDAYEKSTFMAKLYADLADNQALELSYTGNRSDDVLYPSSKMDALYDDSDIVNLDYVISDLGELSKELNLQIYDSQVEHPMSTFYRKSSGADSVNERISKLTTRMSGAKVVNTMKVSETSELKIGLDFSRRNWDGTYEGFGTSAGITGLKSIPDVDTDNQALFLELNQDYDTWKLKFGARLDDTDITPDVGTLPATDFSSVGLFAFATYKMDETHKLFGGLGKASRVPDARELYFRAAMGPNGMLIGNPDLDQTTNTEMDVGVEHQSDGLRLKAKLFYSMLDNYIYYNSSKMMRRFENVDATIYGFDISGSYRLSEEMDMDFGLAWQRGEKDEALAGQTDTDLAEIPPMKMNVALNYNYRNDSSAMIEVVAADRWSDYDADNGEQELDSWAVLNLKVKHQFTRQFGVTAGVDNLLDETYAVSNTYKDLTLLADGTGEIMLLNEPGRYIYLNAVYSF